MPQLTLSILSTTAVAQRAVSPRAPSLRRISIVAGAGRPVAPTSPRPHSSSDLRQLRGVGRTYEALLSAHAIDSIAALQDLYHTSLGASKDELQRFLAVSLSSLQPPDAGSMQRGLPAAQSHQDLGACSGGSCDAPMQASISTLLLFRML